MVNLRSYRTTVMFLGILVLLTVTVFRNNCKQLHKNLYSRINGPIPTKTLASKDDGYRHLIHTGHDPHVQILFNNMPSWMSINPLTLNSLLFFHSIIHLLSAQNSEIKLTDIVSVRQQMKSVHLFNYNTDVSKLVRYIALIIAWPVNYVKFSQLKRKLKLINTSHARYFFLFLLSPFFYIVISRLIVTIYIC